MTLRVLRTSTTGRTPPSGGSNGELAVNLPDGRVWVYDAGGSAVELFASGSSNPGGTLPSTRNIVKHVRSATASYVPASGGEPGTIAINTNSKRMWVFNGSGTPIEITSVQFLTMT